MAKPLKPATTVAQQIDQLRQRGMKVDDNVAAQWLSNVSYYRLSAYWYPARLVNGRGERGDGFVDGTTFDSVVGLYEADRKLRTLVHDAIERVEVAMRTRLGGQLCADDPLAYVDPHRFRPTFDHASWMRTAHKRINRARRHEAIKHYRDQYQNQYPFWVLAEVLDFADVSRLFEGLPAADQHAVAESFGIVVDIDALSTTQAKKAKRHSPLVRWMEQLTIVRNTCVHHGRLWNKSFTPVPTAALRTQPHMALLPAGQSERIFGALTVLAYLLRVISPGTTWPTKIGELIHGAFLDNALVSPDSLGLPPAWDGFF